MDTKQLTINHLLNMGNKETVKFLEELVLVDIPDNERVIRLSSRCIESNTEELLELQIMNEEDNARVSETDNGYQHCKSNVGNLISWSKTAMELWGTITHDEFKEIPGFKEFNTDWPALGRLILVWGWS